MKPNLLGDFDARAFLRRHWQKEPFVARNALNDYVARISRGDLFELATRENIESRIVSVNRGRWTVRHGPFTRRNLARMPPRNWTLLVQGVDHVLPDASRLLREFSFIPYARLDDVMVSYAAPGGGVGAHFDSYDVFLVQTEGRRRWRVSPPRDLDLMPDAPLKVLRRFTPDREWTLEPGDHLYVPPQWPHEGVALDECITCSVGFRAPGTQELASRFLQFLEDRVATDTPYADPDLEPTLKPGRIGAGMMRKLGDMLESTVRWSRDDATQFIGSYLSEPKPNTAFARPRRALARIAFERAFARRGVVLAPATRLLYEDRWIFMNGEAHKLERASPTLHALADERELAPQAACDRIAADYLYEWYLAGYIQLRNAR